MPAAERAKARERLQAIRAEIAAGKLDFAAAAKKFSECPTAKDGGDLGYIRRRGTPEDEPLARAAFALKPCELSEVIETDYGFHVVRVTDRKAGTPEQPGNALHVICGQKSHAFGKSCGQYASRRHGFAV